MLFRKTKIIVLLTIVTLEILDNTLVKRLQLRSCVWRERFKSDVGILGIGTMTWSMVDEQ
jgi:hypothetical protein